MSNLKHTIMGYGKWSSDAFEHLKSSRETKVREEIFTSKKTTTNMDPKGLVFRESRDSVEHPNSVPIMVFLDVTGSMGEIPEILVKKKLGALMETVLTHGVADPQVLFGAIGDQYSDDAPLQIGQFESATKELDQWLVDMFLEGNGGPWGRESYLLAWLAAARHTSLDAFEKRGSKGFLFTIGDERTHLELRSSEAKEIMGYGQAEDYSSKQLLEEAQRMYHVFHIHIKHGGGSEHTEVTDEWKEMLQQNLIILDDYNLVAETIATTVSVISGADKKKVLSSFDKSIAATVSTALVNITGKMSPTLPNSGVVKL